MNEKCYEKLKLLFFVNKSADCITYYEKFRGGTKNACCDLRLFKIIVKILHRISNCDKHRRCLENCLASIIKCKIVILQIYLKKGKYIMYTYMYEYMYIHTWIHISTQLCIAINKYNIHT